MSVQKFAKGDLVRIDKVLPSYMSHFEADEDAIIVGSYRDRFGGGDENSATYTIHIKGRGQVSWYQEGVLTLIAKDQGQLLAQWEAEEKAEREQKSDLDWIFANGAEVVEKGYGASLQALATAHGMGSLWGSRGEGIDYFQNSRMIAMFARPFLLAGDKQGWIALRPDMTKDTPNERG